MRNYIAIIGDIIKSKNIPNRFEFQEKLKDIFTRINTKYSHSIASKFSITIGDEFQAVLFLDKNLLQLLDELYVSIPYNFRLGIGFGSLSTKIDPEISIGADGEAFWNAREAIEFIHNSNYKNRCNIYFVGKKDIDSSINIIFLLSETIKSQWTTLQKDTFAAMINENIYGENFKQYDLARKLNTSESNLSRRLSNGNIKIYLRARNEITGLLEKYYEHSE